VYTIKELRSVNWFKDLHEYTNEELSKMKHSIEIGLVPLCDYYKIPFKNGKDDKGIRMDEWIDILKREFVKRNIK
jgi:hypothetical protein